MTFRRIYEIKPITVNYVKIRQVIIDPHFEEKHVGSVTDELILKLVQKLDNRFEVPETETGSYSYFVTLIDLDSKQYRLVWLLEDGSIYIGVVNAFRDRRKRK